MEPHNSSSSFPDVLRIRTEQDSLQYVRQPALFAVHGSLPDYLKTAVELVLEENSITICRGEPAPSADLPTSLTITPVYALDSHGPLAVPTGQIFIRFTPDVKTEDRRSNLADRGYTIVRIPSYAPHTAWVQATTGDIATSLLNVEQLNGLSGLVNVEPQLLMHRKSK